jgi:hypothetical protein
MDDQTIFLLASKDFYRKLLPYRDASGYHFTDGQKQIIDELESAGLRNLAAKQSNFDDLKQNTELQITIFDTHLAMQAHEFKTQLSNKEIDIANIQQLMVENETTTSGFRNKCAERDLNVDEWNPNNQLVKTPHSSKPKWGLAPLLVIIEVIVNLVSFLALREFLSQDQVFMRIGGNVIIIILLFYADYALAAKRTAVKVTYFMAGTLLLLSSIFGSIVLNEYFPVGQVSNSVWDEASNATTAGSIPKIVGFYRALPIELVICSILLFILTKIGADKKQSLLPKEETPVTKPVPVEEARKILKIFEVQKNELQTGIEMTQKDIDQMKSKFKQDSETLMNEKERLVNDLKRAQDELQIFETQVAMELKKVIDTLETYEREYRGLNSSMVFVKPTDVEILNYLSVTNTLNLLK